MRFDRGGGAAGAGSDAAPAGARPRRARPEGGTDVAGRRRYFDFITQTPFQSVGGSAFRCSQRSM